MRKEPNKKLIGAFMLSGLAVLLVVFGIFFKEKIFPDKGKILVMYFEESINGLNVGAPVVFKGVQIGKVTAIDLITNAGLKAEDIDYLIPHQANIRIIQAVQERLGYSDDKVVTNIKYYGNTSAASIPIALAESVEKGNVKLGTTAVLCGFGAGMTWGGAIVRLREGIC